MSKQKEQEVKSSMSRRGFLKAGSLAMGTVALGGLVAGCGDDVTKIYRNTDSKDKNLPKTWDGEADFVMIGFGGAAAAAAITNKEKGLNASLLILEAQDEDKKPAGQRLAACSTYKCGGGTFIGGGTPVQIANGFSETADELYTATLTTVGEGADPKLIRVYADHAKETFQMLLDAGVQYDGLNNGYSSTDDAYGLNYDNERRLVRDGKLAKAVPHVHFARKMKDSAGNAIGGRGNGLFIPLETKVFENLKTSDKVLYNTRVTRLITNDAGRVVGVAAVKTKTGSAVGLNPPEIESETELYYKAKKAVLLCNGGFIQNKELLEQYNPKAILCNGGTVPSYAGNSMDIGTGLRMAQAIGADTRLLNLAEDWNPVFGINDLAVKGILVNKQGERFVSEDAGGPQVGKLIVAQYPQSWVVIDKVTYDEMKTAGFAVTSFDAKSANTIEDLATLISAPYLKGTVDRFNADVAAGQDKQFDKDPKELRAVSTAPFYAAPRNIQHSFAQTTGGVRINEKSQVMKVDGNPIPGLYAAGAVTSHIHAYYYAAGGSTAGALVFGRIAVQEMAKETAWDAAAKTAAKA